MRSFLILLDGKQSESVRQTKATSEQGDRE